MKTDMVEEEIRKPSPAKQAMPFVFAALILAYMFYKVDFGKILHVLASGDIHPYRIIAAYLVYCGVYFVTDILSFYRAYNRFNANISLGETGRLRFASYAVQAVNGTLTEIMSVLYMLRVKKVPVLNSTSSAAFVYFNETYTMIALLTYCAFLLPEANRIQMEIPVMKVPFWSLFQVIIIIAWIVLPLWLVFFRTSVNRFLPRLYNARILLAFRQANVKDYIEVFSYRFANNLINVLMNIIILKAMGINAPAALLFAAVPIMVNVAYWPVSVGGFGGTQLAAYFLLKGYATEETVIAYSLLWSALFFITRTTAGLAFIKSIYRAAFPD